MSSQEQDESFQPPPSSDPEGEEFQQLLSLLPALLKQYLAEGLALVETEARLAVRSLVLIVALIFCLAGLIAGAWLVFVVLAAYAALEAGMPGWGVTLGVIVVHILAFAGLAQQMKALARYLAFPNSRRAVANLLSREPPAGS